MTIDQAKAEMLKFVKLKTTLAPAFADVLMNADVVTVVRCKDCKHFEPFREKDGFCKIDGMLWKITHYCACGERKDGADDETISL